MHPLKASDDSSIVWAGIKCWLKECTEQHPDCQLRHKSSWKPTRLLHLGSLEEPLRVRLIEGKEVPLNAEYLTLSHLWGDNVPLRLVKGNMDELKLSIPNENLPKTFLDACNATRRLDQEYLWIDSLCIIQDDLEDWEAEAGRMASVYSNAFLNIAASFAEDTTQGLFHSNTERDPDSWRPVRIHRSWGGPFAGGYFVCEYRDWWSCFASSPLNRRAWALQERLLAQRVVHFGLEQVVYECPSMSACERLPFGALPQIHGELRGAGSIVKRVTAWARDTSSKEPSVLDLLLEWAEVVRRYSQGKLSYETDKMVALAGLADSFATVFEKYPVLNVEIEQPEAPDNSLVRPGNEESTHREASASKPVLARARQDLFLAGLWRPMLEMQLAWRATSKVQNQQLNGKPPLAHGTRPKTYIAPSWSWCSLNDAFIDPQQMSPTNVSLTRVIDVKIHPLPDFAPAKADSGYKYCCAPDSYLRLQCSFIPIVGCGKTSMLMMHNSVEFQTRNYWDTAVEEAVDPVTSLPCCVPTYVDMSRVTRPVHGLILDARREGGKADGKRYFVRVGAFVLDEPDEIPKFWEALHSFDEENLDIDPPAEACDGVHRFVKAEHGQHEYPLQNGVLRRVVEIR